MNQEEYYLICKGNKTGIHEWTSFEFDRWNSGIPGDTHPAWAIKVRHCLNCNLHNEEIDETSLPEGYYLDENRIVCRANDLLKKEMEK